MIRKPIATIKKAGFKPAFSLPGRMMVLTAT
jgi:hypothetical protein